MVYIAGDGQVLEARPWSFGALTEMFWGLINFFGLFFRTLINPDSSAKGDSYTTDYRSTGGRGPPPPPRRRFGGFGGRGGAPSSSPPMAGGGGG
jgi:hypothetical protein